MDLYSPAKLKAMNFKQIREARADIVAEIADLEAVANRSSVQEIGLRNLRASLEIADDTLATHGDGSLVTGGMPSTGKANRNELEKFMTFQDAKGNTLYAAAPNQRLADIPGSLPLDAPNYLGGLVVAAITGRRDQLSPSQMAVIGSTSSGGGLTIQEERAPGYIDLMRAPAVLNNAGMLTMPTSSESLQIVRVDSDPVLATKLENEPFIDSSMTFGGINVYMRGVGHSFMSSLDLLENGVNASAIMESVTLRAGGSGVDQCGITGLGTGNEPSGILSFGLADTPVATADFGWESVSAAVLEIEKRNHVGAVALMHPTRMHALLLSKDDEGRWLNRPETLANTRFLASTKCPADRVIVGDFTKFMMCVRNELRLEFSDHAGEVFAKRQRMFRLFVKFNFCCLDSTAFQTLTITA